MVPFLCNFGYDVVSQTSIVILWTCICVQVFTPSTPRNIWHRLDGLPIWCFHPTTMPASFVASWDISFGPSRRSSGGFCRRSSGCISGYLGRCCPSFPCAGSCGMAILCPFAMPRGSRSVAAFFVVVWRWDMGERGNGKFPEGEVLMGTSAINGGFSIATWLMNDWLSDVNWLHWAGHDPYIGTQMSGGVRQAKCSLHPRGDFGLHRDRCCGRRCDDEAARRAKSGCGGFRHGLHWLQAIVWSFACAALLGNGFEMFWMDAMSLA